jgi:hypothetical protein
MLFGITAMRLISQDHDGKFSHNELAGYALDFPMP